MIFYIYLFKCINYFNYELNERYYTNLLVDITNCFFTRSINFNGKGGIIFIENVDLK